MPGNPQRFDRPKLVSRSTIAYYWIPTPNLGRISEKTNFEFKLYLTDEYGNKWVSENGGEAEPTKIAKDEQETDGIVIKVWSYKTTKTEWQLEQNTSVPDTSANAQENL